MSRVDPYKIAAEQIYHEMTGNWASIDVKISPSTAYAMAMPNNKKMYLHPLTLIGPEDLPKDLQVKGPEDPRLQSSEYFMRLKSFLARKFEIDPKKISNLRAIFDMHLRTWQRPHLIDRIKRFAIAHEMGHLFHQHLTRSWDRFFSFVFSILITVLLLELLPIYLAIVLSIGVSDVSRRAFKALREYSEQYQEKEADYIATKITKDFTAAKSFFKALDASYKFQWDSASWMEKLSRILFHTESLFNISHPSPEARIQYLQAAHLKA
ncbi:MAG: hypothetical protein K940chlam6_00861 [Chlamydiae bacterium]|nr:hypothetical protein [Chlamydiota bacterium]